MEVYVVRNGAGHWSLSLKSLFLYFRNVQIASFLKHPMVTIQVILCAVFIVSLYAEGSRCQVRLTCKKRLTSWLA